MIDENELVERVCQKCIEKVVYEINKLLPKIIEDITYQVNINTNKQINMATKDLEFLTRQLIIEALTNINLQQNSYKNEHKDVEKLKRSYGSLTADGWVFYINKDEGERLYKIRLDGSNDTELTKGRIREVDNIEGGWVYYTDFNFESKKVKIN